MRNLTTEKIFFFTLLFFVAVFTLFIFKPFLVVLTLGAALAVVFYPVFGWIKKNTPGNKNWFAALITVFIFIIILCVPLFFMG